MGSSLVQVKYSLGGRKMEGGEQSFWQEHDVRQKVRILFNKKMAKKVFQNQDRHLRVTGFLPEAGSLNVASNVAVNSCLTSILNES